MTNNEALKILTNIHQMNITTWSTEVLEAIEKAIKSLKDIDDCRNELCYKCGNYKQSHLGVCKDCRWE